MVMNGLVSEAVGPLSKRITLSNFFLRYSTFSPIAAVARRPHTTLRIESVNFTIGALEERMMLSGLHSVADIFCCCCGQIIGWKYVSAHEKSQKYKEGKFVLERGRIVDEIDFSTEFYISMSDADV